MLVGEADADHGLSRSFEHIHRGILCGVGRAVESEVDEEAISAISKANRDAAVWMAQ
ncbi:MAG: hypothetical protein ACMG6S_05245 [Byssovorax sp.]